MNSVRSEHLPVHVFAQLLGKLETNRLLPECSVHFKFLGRRVRQAPGKNVVESPFHMKTFILTPTEKLKSMSKVSYSYSLLHAHKHTSFIQYCAQVLSTPISYFC